MRLSLPALALACACTTASADAADWCKQDRPHFGAHEDNFALVQWTRDRGWIDRAERSLRAQFSVKYTLCGVPYDPPASRRDRKGVPDTRTELFIAYTGGFDFYLDQRPSDPVVNRLNNPGLFWRVPTLRWGFGEADDNLTLSLEHRSNGQTTEVTADEEARRAQRLYLERVRPYFDTISTGSNYVGLNYEGVRGSVEFGAKLLLHFSQSSEVRWGPLADQGRRLSDYERLRLRGAYRFEDDRWLDAELRLGDRGARTASMVLGLEWKFGALPLYLRYHRGPLGTLSNYTQKQESIGIGARFARF